MWIDTFLFLPRAGQFPAGAEEEGYDITFISQHAGKNKLSYYEHSKYRGVDGVVIACVDFEDEAILELVNSEIPVVTIDYSFHNKSSILSDNVTGMEEIVQYVVSMGHRDIAYIHGADSGVTEHRLRSFYRTMKDLHVPVRMTNGCAKVSIMILRAQPE